MMPIKALTTLLIPRLLLQVKRTTTPLPQLVTTKANSLLPNAFTLTTPSSLLLKVPTLLHLLLGNWMNKKLPKLMAKRMLLRFLLKTRLNASLNHLLKKHVIRKSKCRSQIKAPMKSRLSIVLPLYFLLDYMPLCLLRKSKARP
jgi:hypothetical protein